MKNNVRFTEKTLEIPAIGVETKRSSVIRVYEVGGGVFETRAEFTDDDGVKARDLLKTTEKFVSEYFADAHRTRVYRAKRYPYVCRAK